MTVFLQLICGFHATPQMNLSWHLCINSRSQNLHGNSRDYSKEISLKIKRKVERFTLSSELTTKTKQWRHYSSVVWKGTARVPINPHIHGLLVFNRVAETIHGPE